MNKSQLYIINLEWMLQQNIPWKKKQIVEYCTYSHAKAPEQTNKKTKDCFIVYTDIVHFYKNKQMVMRNSN